MQLTFIYHYNYFSFPMLGFQNLFKSHITLVFSNKMLFLTQSYFPLPKVCEIRIERSRESLSICFVGITWCTLWSVKTKLREFQTTHQNWTLLSFLSSDCLCPIIIIAQWHKHNYYVYAIVHILFTTTHEEETVRQNDLKIYCPVCCCQKTAAHWRDWKGWVDEGCDSTLSNTGRRLTGRLYSVQWYCLEWSGIFVFEDTRNSYLIWKLVPCWCL